MEHNTKNELINEGSAIRTMNKLIAEFHGSMIIREYHKSWDCLMPVVNRIENLRMDVTIKHFITNNGRIVQECLIDNQSGDTIAFKEGKTKIEATHKAVFEFINWHNSQRGGGN